MDSLVEFLTPEPGRSQHRPISSDYQAMLTTYQAILTPPPSHVNKLQITATLGGIQHPKFPCQYRLMFLVRYLIEEFVLSTKES